MTVLEHLAEVVAQLLRENPRRLLLGEDVADGGMLGLSRAACQDDELRARILTTPLVPQAFVGHVAGLATAGWRPIALLSSITSLVDGIASLREISRLPWSCEKDVPALFVAPFGPGFGLGGDSSEPTDAQLAAVSGLRLLCLSSSEEAGGWLRSAAEFSPGDGPTVLLLPRTLLLQESTNSLETAPFHGDIGRRPTIVRHGNEITVFAWGSTVESALAAQEQCGVDATIVDIGCLAPLDKLALLESARNTGKIVIVHAGPKQHGLGAELAGLFADEAILTLDAPVLRITGREGPLGPNEEHLALPDVADIAKAMEHVAHY